MTALKVLSDVDIPIGDGLTAPADIYRPDDGDQHPVLLARTPYSRALANLGLFNPLRAARRGYVVVIQDCRGRFGAPGEFRPFECEAVDGAAAIEWCARQPWSDGRVGMWGASYVGATQLLAATVGTDALVAIAPSFTPTSYRNGWLLEHDAVQQHFLQTWAVSVGTTMRGATREARRSLGMFGRDPNDFLRPLAEAFDEAAASAVPHYRDWLNRRDDASYWNALDIDRTYGSLNVAGLHIGGWYDAFLEGTLANFIGLSSDGPRAQVSRAQRLVVGPWEHTVIESVVGEIDFGPSASALGVDLAGRQLRFFDAVMAGTEPDQPPVQLFVMGANVWIDLPAWPPPTTNRTWHPAGRSPQSVRGDGRLSPAAGPDREWTLLFDPRRPVPSVGGRLVAPGSRIAGPRDQKVVEVRDDVLVFTSEQFAEPLTVIGEVRAKIEAASTASSYDLVVKLTDVHPDGRSFNVVDGVQRIQGTDSALTTVCVGSTAHQFRPGHRMRLQIAASNHPRLDLSGTAQSLTTIGSAGTRLILPVLEGELA